MGDALLVADIGGTNARFALADPHAATPLLADSVREFPVAAFPSLAEAAAHYLDQVGTRARRGVFAVAGRIDGDQARITNHPWVISRSRTAQMLGFDQVHLLNDFAAQAMAIRLFGPDDVVRIGAPDWSPAPPEQARTYAVLGPGTGLGVGRPGSTPAIWHNARWMLTRPGPQTRRSLDTRPNWAESSSRMRISSGVPGGKLTWPPSVCSGWQRPSRTIRPPTPRPVPGPSTA